MAQNIRLTAGQAATFATRIYNSYPAGVMAKQTGGWAGAGAGPTPPVAGYVFLDSEYVKDSNYYGEAWKNPNTGEVIVVSRGTVPDLRDAKADLQIASGNIPPSAYDALAFTNRIAGLPGNENSPIISIGHSKGGYEAQYVNATLTNEAINQGADTSRFLAVTADAPAFSQATIAKFPAGYAASNATNFIARTDPVSQLTFAAGYSLPGRTVVVPLAGMVDSPTANPESCSASAAKLATVLDRTPVPGAGPGASQIAISNAVPFLGVLNSVGAAANWTGQAKNSFEELMQSCNINPAGHSSVALADSLNRSPAGSSNNALGANSITEVNRSYDAGNLRSQTVMEATGYGANPSFKTLGDVIIKQYIKAHGFGEEDRGQEIAAESELTAKFEEVFSEADLTDASLLEVNGTVYVRLANGEVRWVDPQGGSGYQKLTQNADGSTSLTARYADGSVQEGTRTAEGNVQIAVRDSQGNLIAQKSVDVNGNTQAQVNDPTTGESYAVSVDVSKASLSLSGMDEQGQVLELQTPIDHASPYRGDSSEIASPSPSLHVDADNHTGNTGNPIISDAGPHGPDSSPGFQGDPDFYSDDYVYTPGTTQSTPLPWEGASGAQGVAAFNLVQGVQGLANWSSQTDAQHLGSLLSLYNSLDTMAGGALPGELGGIGSVLNLVNAIESGNTAGILGSAASLGQAGASMAANSMAAAGNAAGAAQMGNFAQGLGNVAGVIGMGSAIEKGDMLGGAMSGFMAFGPIGGIVGFFAAAFNGLSKDEDPYKGHAEATLNDSGALVSRVTLNERGGSEAAQHWMDTLLGGVQGQLSQDKDAGGNPKWALVPGLVPSVGYLFDPDGIRYTNGAQGQASTNGAALTLSWIDEQGQTQTRYYDASGNRNNGSMVSEFYTIDGESQSTGERQIHIGGSSGGKDGVPDIVRDFHAHVGQAVVPAEQAQANSAAYTALAGPAGELERQIATLQDEADGIAPRQVTEGTGQDASTYTQPSPEPERYEALLARIAALQQEAQGLRTQAAELLKTQAQAQNKTYTEQLHYSAQQQQGPKIIKLDEDDANFKSLHDRTIQNTSRQSATQIQAGDARVRGNGLRGLVLSGDADVGQAAWSTAVATAAQITGAGASAAGLYQGQTATQKAASQQGRVVSDARAQAPAPAAPRKTAEIIFVPQGAASASQAAREAAAQMVNNAQGALGAGGLALGMALGAAGSASAANFANGETGIRSGQAPGTTSAAAGQGYTLLPADGHGMNGVSGAPGGTNGRDEIHYVPAVMGSYPIGSGTGTGMGLNASATDPAIVNPIWTDWAGNASSGGANGGGASHARNPIVIPVLQSLPSGGSAPGNGVGAGGAPTLLIEYPRVEGETLTGREDTGIRLPQSLLLGNDSTSSVPSAQKHSALTITAVGNATHGTVRLEGSEVVFIPDADFHDGVGGSAAGLAGFEYTVTDPYGLSSVARATLHIEAVNDAPVTGGEVATTDEDTDLLFNPADLLANDSDVDTATDGQSLRIGGIAGATHGTATLGADGRIQFTPEADYNDSMGGPATVTYLVSDGAGGQTPATIIIHLNPVNDAPRAADDATTTREDEWLEFGAAQLLANDLDVDDPSSTLRLVGIGSAAHGSVQLLGGTAGNQRIRFVPDANYHGETSFTYTVADPSGATATATAHLTIAPVNDAPIARDDGAAMDEDTGIVFTAAQLLANDSDVDSATDGDTLRLVDVGGAVNGSVSFDAAGNVRFVPNADYHGQASFSYTVADNAGATSSATVHLGINPINDDPVDPGQPLQMAEDTQITILAADLLARASDPDNPQDAQVLRVTAVSGATHGSVQLLPNGNIQFTPEADYVGTATFQYTVSDGAGGTTQATASVAITPVNDAPLPRDDAAQAIQDTPLVLTAASLLANDMDIDSTALRVAAVGAAQHGTVTLLPDGNVKFTPQAGYWGSASFEYTVDDGAGGTASATVNLSIAQGQAVQPGGNHLPLAQDDTLPNQEEDTNILIPAAALLANDSDADASNVLAITSVSAIAGQTHGTVTLQPDGKVLFVPDANYAGAVSFRYTVSDGAGGAASAIVSLTLDNVNDAPVAAGETITTGLDTPVTVSKAALLANDWDPDAGDTDTLTISAVSGALHGTAVLQPDGSVKFTPDAGYSGTAAQFSYTVTDSHGASAIAVARLRVGIANQAPTVVGEAIEANQDQTLLIAPSLLLANDGDSDNPQSDLFISGVGAASHGTVSLAGGQISFVPEPGYTGGAWFQYTVSDGAGGATVGTVNLNIQPVFVNQAPEVYGEDIALDEDQIATISAGALLANDMDPNGDALSIVNVDSGTPGFAIHFDGANIVFTPPLNFNGPASFTYDVSDGRGGLSRGTASVLFNPVNDVPAVNGEQVSGVQDTAYVIDAASLLANDTDVETPTQLTLAAVGNATHGDVALIGDSVVFNPEPGYVGKAVFYYAVRDPQGGEAYGSVEIDLARGAHVNLPPVVDSQGGPIDHSTYDESGFATGGARFSGSVAARDPDGGTLSYSVGGSPHGHVSVDDAGNWTYASDQVDPHRGPDSFTIEISDGQGGVTSVPITVTHDRGFPPVVIDLGGNGLDLLSAEDSGMRLDVDGDGTRERVGWVAPSDGVLVFDANHDGWMGSRLAERGSGGDSAGYRGSNPDWWIPTRTADASLLEEVSFVRYMPGARTDMEGLQAFDTNGDGLLSLNDADWKSFGMFQDHNANGQQDEGELRSLDAWGIESIGLTRRGDVHTNQGNTVWGISDVRFKDGHVTQAGDVQFAAIPAMTPEMELQAQAIQSARTFVQFGLFASGNRDEPPLGFVPSTPERIDVVSALHPNGTREDIQLLP